jgi:hypothetical protein
MRRSTQIILGSWLALAVACWGFFALAAPGVPGPYFDELVQAGPAADFLRNDWNATHLPEMVRVSVAGRPWPWMTTSYMGALKSQALIPSVALFGARTEVVRGSTMAWAFVGLLLAMLWVERSLGLVPALVMAVVVVSDPSFVWIARHDWGSFALGFLLRMAGLWLLVVGWQRGSMGWMGCAGVALGLTVYNKIDGAVFLLAATGVAWGVGFVRTTGTASRARLGAALLAGLLLGAMPILLQATTALRVTSAAVTSRPQNYGEKLEAWWRTLDGSYFERLMRAGGMFAEMYDVEGAARSPRGVMFLMAAVALGVLTWRSRAAGHTWQGAAWVLGTWLATTIGVLLTPDAARIHHHLLVAPMPALAVGLLVAAVWQRAEPFGLLRYATNMLLVALVFLGVWQNMQTAAVVRETGGSGLWTSGLAEWIERQQALEEIAGSASAVQVRPASLDWGFHEQLQFLAPDLQPEDLVWPIAAARAAQKPAEIARSEQTVYFVHPPEYSLSSIGGILLGIAEQMPVELVRVEPLTNRAGEVSALTIQFTRPHKITIDANGEVGLAIGQ